MKLKMLCYGVACSSLASTLTSFAQEVGRGQQAELEEIVVTGSLISGTPLDAALPVDVYTTADLRELGTPTALEFVKSLSISGPTTGEGYYFSNAQLTGNVGYNLRGIGADKTLTLFNGRRVWDNSSVIPAVALHRIEILKDGAAVTYGADATGGVVNLITRDSFEGFEISSSYKYFGSDGDWSVSMLGGFGGGATNVMFAAEWDHRSELDTQERDFSSLPYSVNPAPSSTLTNLAGWVPRGALPATPGNTANEEWGTPLGLVPDYTQGSCEAVGGVFVSQFACAYNYIPYYNIVEENDIYRLFAQVNSAVSESVNFHLDAALGRVHTPHAYGSPAQPVIRGPARATGLTHQFYAPSTNPYAAEFAQRTGWAASPLFGFTQGYTAITYRAFAHGGNDTFAEGNSHSTPREIDNKYGHVSAGIDGKLAGGLGYDFAITYNQTVAYNDNPDVIGYRLQEALNGFGGPSCNVPDLDPVRFGTQNPALAGTGGCMWWNPFASSFAGQPVLGLANPSYVPGSENPMELIEWVFNERAGENITSNLTVDLVFDRVSSLELPGGPLAWGAGAQWRKTELRERTPDPLFNGNQPCPWPNGQGQVPLAPDDPGFNGCTPDEPGPFTFFGTDVPEFNEQTQYSYFGELNLPFLDKFYMTAAVRHERFTGGLDATVFKVSAKWDVTDRVAFRASRGTNYQAPGVGVVPGEVVNAVNSYTIAAGNWRGNQTVTVPTIEPETATVSGLGFIWQGSGGFRFFLDYFDIETEDELGLLASTNDIADAVFSISPGGPGTPVPTNGTALADCSHPLAGRVTFNGSCVQGTTTANDFASIRTDFGNGPGQHTAGYDLRADYGFPLARGDFRLSVSATRVTKFRFTETVLDGFVLDPGDDRLGTLNFATIANAAPKWRGNINANYAQGPHNFRFVLNYISGVDDERFFNPDGTLVGDAALTPAGRQPGTMEPFGPSLYGVFGEDWITGDFHYVVRIPWATVSASIVNISDEDPPASRQELGYDPRIGNPLGRGVEVGFRKQF